MLTRRGLLGTAAVAALAVTSGCVRRDPPMAGRPTIAPSEAAPPDTTVDLAHHAALEAGLAAAAGGGAARLGAFQARAAADFSTHAEVLAAGTRAPAATGDFAAACRSVAAAHLAATARGTVAARLASAAGYATAAASLTAAKAPRTPTSATSAETVPVLGDAEAVTGLLLQLYPAVYAAEAAVARLSGEDAEWARATLVGHRAARQQLAAELARRSLQVPPAEVAYDLGSLADTPAVVGLLARVESAVLPAACRLVRAAVDDPLRLLGGAVLEDAAVAVARAGGALPTWPGWG